MLEILAVEMVKGITDKTVNHFLKMMSIDEDNLPPDVEDSLNVIGRDKEDFIVFYVNLVYQCYKYIKDKGLTADNVLRQHIVSGLAKLFNVVSHNWFELTGDDMGAYLEREIIPYFSLYDSKGDKPDEMPIALARDCIEAYASFSMEVATGERFEYIEDFRHKMNSFLVDSYGLPDRYYKKKESTAPATTGIVSSPKSTPFDFDL